MRSLRLTLIALVLAGPVPTPAQARGSEEGGNAETPGASGTGA